MIRHYTYRLRVLFTLVLLTALCANFSEELKEKEVQERNEKIDTNTLIVIRLSLRKLSLIQV